MSDTYPTAADDFWGNSDQGSDYDPGEAPDEEYYEFDDTWDTSAEESTSARPGSEPVPTGIPDRFIQGLNPAQRQAVEALSGPLMVIAGPGSGKTRVLTHRIAALLATGTLPWQVLAVTFTNKAAAEMRQRLTVLLGEEAAASMWVATFHSACLRILRYNAEEAGLPKSFSICDTSDAQRIIKGLLSTDGSAVELSLVKETLAGISRAKNAGKSSGDLVHSSNPHERALAQIMYDYEQRLLEIGAVDFDDILLKTLHLLQRNPLVAERYQSKFHHILVDEYQDTNPVQMQIIQLLAAGHGNLCVVGDLDQCHPAGTIVNTVAGPVPIEELDPEKHRLVSWARNERDSSIRGYGKSTDSAANRKKRGFAFELGSRNHTGQMLTVSAGGKQVDLTPQHKVFVKWNRAIWDGGMHTALYLMRKGDWWRLGVSLVNRTGASIFGPAFRARCEKAEDMWILDVFPTKREALVAEKVVAANFGLPTLVFESPTSGVSLKPSKDGLPPMDADTIRKVFEGIEDMEGKALRVLGAYGRDRNYPFWSSVEEGRSLKGGAAYSKEMHACNLISGIMDLPVEGDDHKIEWHSATVQSRPYDDVVYSLNVDRHHNYVADGIVVSNCIYSWRGSSPEAMAEFTNLYPDAQMVVLEQNYRSTPEILKVAQAIIDPNPALHRPHLFTENASGAPVRLYVADDDREEAAWVASQIKATRDDLDAHAILVRTNAQTRSFEEALSKSGMAYQVVGSLRFYDRAEVKDALSYLRVALNPKDAVNLARCINTPKRGIGDATVDAIVKLAQEKKVDPITLLREDLAGANELPTRARKPLAAFLEVYDAVVEAASDSPAAALEVVAEKGGLRAALEKDKSEGPDRVENLQELIAGAREFVLGTSSTRPEVGLVKDLPGWEQTESFLENVALVSAADDEDVKVSRVSVLTAHASKGKEFPHVFVVGVEDTLYPHERSKGDPASEEEERRLLFVAASRAERTLTITRCKRRFVFNSIKENPPSPFLRDLPDSVERVQPRYPQRSGMGGFSHGFARPPARVQPRTPAGRPSSLGGGVKPRAAAGPRLSIEQLQSGVVVEHPVFGRGTVVSTERNTVTITFGSARKVLDVSFAPLSLAARDA